MKVILCVTAFLFLATSAVMGQEEESPIIKFLAKKGYVFPDSARRINSPSRVKEWPDTLYYNTSYKSKLLGSITIPFFFNNIEIYRGKYTVTPTVNIGLGYTWFWGSFIFNENDKITVDSKAYFGLMANTGLQNGLSLKDGGFFTCGFIGVSSFTLIFGYDIINESPTLGIGGRIDLYTISSKFLHILGRVHEVRKHKHIALPITRE